MRIVMHEYDANWPLRFDDERLVLERALAPWLTGGVHHLGSTSVPGLAAKPILDMMAGVRDLDETREAIPSLTAVGYMHDQHRSERAHDNLATEYEALKRRPAAQCFEDGHTYTQGKRALVARTPAGGKSGWLALTGSASRRRGLGRQ